jgi:hypothetical protein
MEYIKGYYIFTLQQYIIHRIQHTTIYRKHILQHHLSYDRNDITKIKKRNTLFQNLDLYFYGNIFTFIGNHFLFSKKVILFQLFLSYLSYYFHNEYHNPKSLWRNYRFFIFLKDKHTLHHRFTTKNHFLIDPTFDVIFRTFI